MQYIGIFIFGLIIIGAVAAIFVANEKTPTVSVGDLEANPLIMKLCIAGINYRQNLGKYVGRFKGELRPEPTNEYDPNAIAIYHSDGHHLGYVPSVDTRYLHSLLYDRFPYECVGEICDAGDHFYGYIFLIKPE